MLYHSFNFRKMDLFKKNIYMLCSGAYTAGDFASLGMYKNRTYRWGYFPEVKEHNTDELFSKKKTDSIMWCGRFIDWKHPDDAVLLARKLKEKGYVFQLNVVGTGAMEAELKQLVNDYGLSDCVRFLGSMPPEQVRTHMEQSGIFLFTSDRQEGWGAVLNESMNSGCAVVASDAIGSVPFLISDKKNGSIYSSGDIDMLFENVRYFLDNPLEQKKSGRAAYETTTALWNASSAADRILKLSERLLSGEEYPTLFESGPCSKAKILKDK